MKTVSVVNIKGGVGKTISTVNIGACLQEQGYKVLIIDMDAQANASQILKTYSSEDKNVTDILLDKSCEIKKVIKHSEFENLDVLPSNLELAFAERKILLDTTRSQQNRLRKALDNIEDDYDYCLIDCPPSLSIVTINALVASDEVLVPIKIDQFALDGLGYLIDSIDEIREEFNSKLKFRGCFVTMDVTTTVNKLVKEKLKETLGDKLLHYSIKNNVKVTESTFDQKPVVFYDKKAQASKDYRKLTEEFLKEV